MFLIIYLICSKYIRLTKKICFQGPVKVIFLISVSENNRLYRKKITYAKVTGEKPMNTVFHIHCRIDGLLLRYKKSIGLTIGAGQLMGMKNTKAGDAQYDKCVS